MRATGYRPSGINGVFLKARFIFLYVFIRLGYIRLGAALLREVQRFASGALDDARRHEPRESPPH